MGIITYIKAGLLTAAGFVISAAAALLGGYDRFLEALIVCMAIDFATGILLSAWFKRSKKTVTGRLASNASFKGLMKKGGVLLTIAVAVILDGLMEAGGLTRNAVIVAFVLNESVSILENIGLMGVRLPAPLTDALEWLSKAPEKKG